MPERHPDDRCNLFRSRRHKRFHECCDQAVSCCTTFTTRKNVTQASLAYYYTSLIQMWGDATLLLPGYVNRKSPVMTICIVKWWPFSNQTNIQCYSSILQHGKEPSSTYSWSVRLLFLLHPRFQSWVVVFFLIFYFSYVFL